MADAAPSSDDPLGFLAKAEQPLVDELHEDMPPKEREEWPYFWKFQAHDGQRPPPGQWQSWLIMAGRGFGKTRAGAEWVNYLAETNPAARIALVAASLVEARAVMVEGESGVLRVGAPWRRPKYESSLRRIVWPNGAEAHLYSAAEPESLRGPQHSHAWCDEIAKWDNANNQAMRCWDNLLLGLRLGSDPRNMATTTPRPVPLLKRLLAREGEETVVTRGKTHDNAQNLPTKFIAAITREFGNSLLGRQEVEGELIADIDGALWTRGLLEACRTEVPFSEFRRVVIGVDPPASAQGDACGIVVAALGVDGIGRVVADCSVTKPTPEQWARATADAAKFWGADRVIAEANQGGDMVESVLRASDINLPVKLVRATRGKSARAEPVAALYEAGRVRHVGMFAALEDELCGLMPGGGYEGPGRSPDRADALVWALSELMLSSGGEPRVWVG